jgi:hypothetical protein
LLGVVHAPELRAVRLRPALRARFAHRLDVVGELAGGDVVLRRAHDQDRAGRDADEPLGHRADDRARDALVAVRADDHEARLERAREPGDRGRRRAAGLVDEDVRVGHLAVLQPVRLERRVDVGAQTVDVRLDPVEVALRDG